jgi:ComF family protein
MLIIKIIKKLLSIKFCIYCYKTIINGHLCVNCWQHIRFWNNELCGICGNYRINDCYSCEIDIKIIFIYNNLLKDLILKFKYGNKFFIGGFFVNYLRSIYKPKDNLVILYIPHYFPKQITTSFNSSLLLAYEFQKEFGGEIIHNFLTKTSKIRQKDTKNFKERINTHNRFSIIEANKYLIKNKHVVLIDDVVATGSTITTCSLLIKNANPLSLQVFAIGKTY